MKLHPLGLSFIIAFAWAVVAAPLLAARAADIQTTAETLYITDSANGEIVTAEMPVAGKKMYSMR